MPWRGQAAHGGGGGSALVATLVLALTPQVFAQPLAPDGGVSTLPKSAPAAVDAASDVSEVDLSALLNQDIRTQTVTAVSRRAEKVGEAPATVTVIGRDDFVKNHWRSVADALWSVPGVFVSDGRDYRYTGIRGISFPRDVDTRVLVLLDGHTLNDPWNAGSNTNELMSLPPEAIERVEVIRGPSSSIYGSNAFFGVVNIVSRKPSEKQLHHTLVDVGGSTEDRGRAVVTTQDRAGPIDVSVFATALGGTGPQVRFSDITRPRLDLGAPTATFGVTHGTDYERGLNAGGLASFHGLSLQLRYSDRWKGLPTAPADSIFNDPYNSLTDVHGLAELRYEQPLGAHALTLRAYTDRFRHRDFLHRDPTDWPQGAWVHPDPHTISEGNDDTLGLEAQLQLQLHEKDHLIVGSEVQRHFITQPTYELDPVTGGADPTTVAGGIRDASGMIRPIDMTNAAVYLQNDFRPRTNLGLVVGARLDHNSVFSHAGIDNSVWGAITPRVAVIYTPVEAATFKATYGEAFRNPSVFEAFFDDRASVCGNPDLSPEHQRSGELATALELGKGVNVTASAYATQLRGLLVKESVASCYEGSGPRTRYANGGTISVFGGEAGLDLRLGFVSGYASFGLSQATEQIGGSSARPPNSPAFVGTLGVAYPFIADRLIGSARLRGLSSREDWTQTDSGTVPAYLRGEVSVVLLHLLFGLDLSTTVAVGGSYLDPVTSSETLAHAVPQGGTVVKMDLGYEH